MKKLVMNRTKIILFIFTIIAGACFSKFYFYSKDTVKVYGDIFYEDYKEGDIVIFWRKDLKKGSPIDKNNPHIVKKVPGTYNIRVPRSVGSFFVCARCTAVSNIAEHDSVAYYVSDLITIDPGEDKIRLDIHLITRKILMDFYVGPTVMVSGRVIHKNYKKGLIAVTVESPENHKKIYWPPDIALKPYSGCGNYSIEVPANIGEVYVNAINYPEAELSKVAGDMPGVIFSTYENNPIDVRISNIEDINIILK